MLSNETGTEINVAMSCEAITMERDSTLMLVNFQVHPTNFSKLREPDQLNK